jgi:hypothetical protein
VSTNLYLAVFLGSKNSPQRLAWDKLSDPERQARQQQGMAAWGSWIERHRDAIVTMGGPLGKTKSVSTTGAADISNQLSAFTIVRADSHEAAARMFEKHPHFAIFPGEAIEVMPVLPIPGG